MRVVELGAHVVGDIGRQGAANEESGTLKGPIVASLIIRGNEIRGGNLSIRRGSVLQSAIRRLQKSDELGLTKFRRRYGLYLEPIGSPCLVKSCNPQDGQSESDSCCSHCVTAQVPLRSTPPGLVEPCPSTWSSTFTPYIDSAES
jgi:hypothetical protein